MVLSLFKTVMALIRDNTKNALKSGDNAVHAIASTCSKYGRYFPDFLRPGFGGRGGKIGLLLYFFPVAKLIYLVLKAKKNVLTGWS